MNSGIEAQITALIASTLHIEPALIRPAARIEEDLGADSLAQVSLILAIEDEFRIDIHDEDAAEILTVEQMIEYVTVALAVKDVTAVARLGSNASLRV